MKKIFGMVVLSKKEFDDLKKTAEVTDNFLNKAIESAQKKVVTLCDDPDFRKDLMEQLEAKGYVKKIKRG